MIIVKATDLINIAILEANQNWVEFADRYVRQVTPVVRAYVVGKAGILTRWDYSETHLGHHLLDPACDHNLMATCNSSVSEPGFWKTFHFENETCG